jgi:hypothetical protein
LIGLESYTSKVGGRPWTKIIREDQRKSPLGFLLIFAGLGIMTAKLTGKYWWQILLGFLLGVLCGHFWW